MAQQGATRGPAAFVAPAAVPHAGPPIWLDLFVREGEVELRLSGEPDALAIAFGVVDSMLEPLSEELVEGHRSHFQSWFAEHNLFRIDDQPVAAKLTTMDFPRDAPDSAGLLAVRMSFVFPCEGLPGKVSFDWENFDGATWLGEAFITVLVRDPLDTRLVSLTPEEPGYTWHAPANVRKEWVPAARDDALPVGYRELPLASFGLVLLGLICVPFLRRAKVPGNQILVLVFASLMGSFALRNVGRVALKTPWTRSVSLPPEDQALTIFEGLHRGIYAAFEQSTESDIYDALARNVELNLLDSIYLEVYESLIMREQQGAVAEIESIEVMEREFLAPTEGEIGADSARYQVGWNWRTHGMVSHWGHIHRRVNEYRAVYDVEHDGHAWKIAGFEISDHRRIDDGQLEEPELGLDSDSEGEEDWEAEFERNWAEQFGSEDESESEVKDG